MARASMYFTDVTEKYKYHLMILNACLLALRFITLTLLCIFSRIQHCQLFAFYVQWGDLVLHVCPLTML